MLDLWINGTICETILQLNSLSSLSPNKIIDEHNGER